MFTMTTYSYSLKLYANCYNGDRVEIYLRAITVIEV
jgi:hypothetical protein